MREHFTVIQTIYSPSGDRLRRPRFSGLHIPYRGCRAAAKDASGVDSAGPLVLLTLYNTSVLLERRRSRHVVLSPTSENITIYDRLLDAVDVYFIF